MGYTNKREWNSKYSRPTIESATNRATIHCNKCNELKVRDRNKDMLLTAEHEIQGEELDSDPIQLLPPYIYLNRLIPAP